MVLSLLALASAHATDWRLQVDPTAHVGPIYAVAVSPTGEQTASIGADGTLRFWLPELGEALVVPAPLRAAPATRLGFSADGSHLAVVSGDRAVVVDSAEGERAFSARTTRVIAGFALSSDGRTLALSHGPTVEVHDAAGLVRDVQQAHHTMGALVFVEDDELVFSGLVGGRPWVDPDPVRGTYGGIEVRRGKASAAPFPVHDLHSYDAETDIPLDPYAILDSPVHHLVRDEDVLLSSGRDVRLSVAHTPSAAVLHRGPSKGSTTADLSLARGRVAGFDSQPFTYWSVDLGTGTVKRGGPEHRLPSPSRGALDLDADLGLIGDSSGALLWFRPSDRRPVALAAAGVAPLSAAASDGAIALLGDSEGRLTWLMPEGHARLRTVGTGEGPILDLAVWNGFVASCGSAIQVRSVETGEVGWSLERADARAVAWSGDRLLTGHGDGQIRVWHGGDQPVATWEAHVLAVRDLAVSPDGATLASLGVGGTLRLMALPDGTVPRDIARIKGARSMAFTADGRGLVVLADEGEGRTAQLVTLQGTTQVLSTRARALVGDQVLVDTETGPALLSPTGTQTSVTGLTALGDVGVATSAHLVLSVDDGLGYGVFAPSN